MLLSGSSRPPRVIAHRGACGLLPEHTIAAYALAIEAGADAIELDLVCTRDGRLVARHDAELSLTTDVADRPAFAGRKSLRIIDGVAAEGWFVEDFTLAEIKLLGARQRFSFRDRSHDGRYPIPTLDEVIDLVKSHRSSGRIIDLYLELKHPSHHAAIGLPLARPLLDLLDHHGLRGSRGGVCIESFEPTILRRLREDTSARIVQLIDAAAIQPADLQASGDSRTFGDFISTSGLRDIATWANGIGVWKRLIVPLLEPAPPPAGETAGWAAQTTSLVDDATAAGLFVEVWTLRDEPRYLAADYRGDPAAEYRHFAALGVAGVITDFPSTAMAAYRSWGANPVFG